MTMILFDTDVLIDHLRGESVTIDLLQTLKNQVDFLSIFTITLAEIEAGIKLRERQLVASFSGI